MAVDEVMLYYQPVLSNTFTAVQMTYAGTTNEYQASTIVSLIEGSIHFYVWANDTSGNENTTSIGTVLVTGDIASPVVLLATPTGDNIPISTSISIVFSEAVNQTSVEGAISISPTLTGIGYNWLDNQTLIIETDNLSYNTIYTVTIDAGVKDLAGNTLVDDYSWQFTTVAETEIIQPLASNNWGWIGIVILLIAIIILMLFNQFSRERKEKETEEEKKSE